MSACHCNAGCSVVKYSLIDSVANRHWRSAEVFRTILVIVQFLLSFALIAVVILQPSKGEGLGSIGGGGQLFFSKKKGLEAFLDKATTWVAVAFMLTSILFIVA